MFRAGELPALHHFVWRWIWKYTCKRAAAFVCDSRFVRDRIAAIGAPLNLCEVIYAPAPKRQSVAKTVPQSNFNTPLTVLYVGQISADKGVDLLIKVARRLVVEFPVRFVVAGDYCWHNSLGEALVNSIQEVNLQDRIIFTGYVNDIEPLYHQAGLHVAPSICDESYGLTVIEAKEHGIPSIVFPSGGLVELVEHGRDGWICADRSEPSLEAALRYYLDNSARLIDQGKGARTSLVERLRVHEYGAHWARIYGLPPNQGPRGTNCLLTSEHSFDNFRL
jgi:glycosyltransferase involved in cell wall biosynthesis